MSRSLAIVFVVSGLLAAGAASVLGQADSPSAAADVATRQPAGVIGAPAPAGPDDDAAAQPDAAPEARIDSPQEVAEVVQDAWRGGRWLPVIGLAIAGLTWLARRYLGGPKVWPWLRTDRGGVAASLAVSLLAELANTLVAGGAAPGATFSSALAASWAASGAFSQILRLIAPPDRKDA